MEHQRRKFKYIVCICVWRVIMQIDESTRFRIAQILRNKCTSVLEIKKKLNINEGVTFQIYQQMYVDTSRKRLQK